MQVLKFKTNIKCGGCIAKVSPFLNQMEGISNWEVDTTSADKILTVKTEKLSPAQIRETIKNAGYEALSI
ncbi:MAG: heavy-metal-associated domain-containing protein [Microscillaceae bacterium]|jgi:copper chaperone|nr:heavy-metal-associated domain-containing protein [Microscillaceae bacterium]